MAQQDVNDAAANVISCRADPETRVDLYELYKHNVKQLSHIKETHKETHKYRPY